jgi:hypothetical protein
LLWNQSVSFLYGDIKQVLCAVVNNSYSAGSCEPIYIHGERREKLTMQAKGGRGGVREGEEGGRQDPEDRIGGGARWCRPNKHKFIQPALESTLAIGGRTWVNSRRRIAGAPVIGRRSGLGWAREREAHAP